jgi:hypothetical protein
MAALERTNSAGREDATLWKLILYLDDEIADRHH